MERFVATLCFSMFFFSLSPPRPHAMHEHPLANTKVFIHIFSILAEENPSMHWAKGCEHPGRSPVCYRANTQRHTAAFIPTFTLTTNIVSNSPNLQASGL